MDNFNTMTEKEIELLVRGGKWGVQLDVRKFPVYCLSCESYLNELYIHQGSRYGQVGNVICDCGETLRLTDGDNIVEYISVHQNNKKLTIDFKELFDLSSGSFTKLKDKYNYDIFERHLGERVELSSLVNEIENLIGKSFKAYKTNFPATESQKKWLSLIRN